MKSKKDHLDNIEATGNNLDNVESSFYDKNTTQFTRVTATVSYDEVTGINNPDGTNTLEGIDNMDSINQMADMDRVASRKGMVDLKDTVDTQNTEEINNLDYLSSSNDIGYADDDSTPHSMQCPNCGYEFSLLNTANNDDITCPQCRREDKL